MTSFILFVFGVAIGSFLNVVTMRYDGEKFLFDTKALGGRSHCPHCKRTLQWFELIPLLSFLLQMGRCRNCNAALSVQYPIVEFISALIFVFIPLRAAILYPAGSLAFYLLATLWVIAFEFLLVVSVVDLRMGIIPDEANVALGVLGIFFAIFAGGYLNIANHSLLLPYAVIFGAQENIWLAHVLGALLGGAFFAALVFITRGKGMGMGDVKLALALGLLFGWPDIALLGGVAFVLGALVGVIFIALGKKTMKATLPFGPFLALGSAVVFFYGMEMLTWYFRLTGL